jgi:hypothetical protein
MSSIYGLDFLTKILNQFSNIKENCRMSYLFKNRAVFFMNPRFRMFDEEFFGDMILE